MKIFVLTDNPTIYNSFKEIISKKKSADFDFFCSPSSSIKLQQEINNGHMKEILIREVETELITKYDLGISCHSKQIFPRKLVNEVRCINVHPGFNPYNRGWYPQVFSILNKLPAGATIHEMDEKIDHGAIIAQKKVQVESEDTSLTLYNRIIETEIELLEQNFDSILQNSYSKFTPFSDGNYNTVQDYVDLCQINLNEKKSVGQTIDYLRAMSHPPYKNAFFYDQEGNKIFIEIKLEKTKQRP